MTPFPVSRKFLHNLQNILSGRAHYQVCLSPLRQILCITGCDVLRNRQEVMVTEVRGLF